MTSLLNWLFQPSFLVDVACTESPAEVVPKLQRTLSLALEAHRPRTLTTDETHISFGGPYSLLRLRRPLTGISRGDIYLVASDDSMRIDVDLELYGVLKSYLLILFLAAAVITVFTTSVEEALGVVDLIQIGGLFAIWSLFPLLMFRYRAISTLQRLIRRNASKYGKAKLAL